MTTVEFTSTVLGDESAVSSDISREVVWAVAGEDLTAGNVVRLKQSVTGAVVELYDYGGTPDSTLPPYGVVLTTTLSGNSVPVVIAGMVPNSITGLLTAATNDPVTVSTAGLPVRNPTYLGTDWVIGIVDTQGRLQLFPAILGSAYARGVSVNNVTELRALVGVASQVCTLTGYTTAGDNGGGLFVWSTTAATDNAGTRFNAGGFGSSSAGWRRIWAGDVSVKWFGATGDGSTDDRTAIQRALNYASSLLSGSSPYNSIGVRIPNGFYRVASTVEVNGSLRLSGDDHACLLATTHTFPILRCGMANNTIEHLKFLGGKHAIAMFGSSTEYGGNIGDPANTQSVCRISDCIFWDQRGPVVWQDTSQSGQDRALAGHIVIEGFNHRGAVLFWGGCDALSIRKGWAQVDNTTYPVSWGDGRPMSWICSHGVVDIDAVACAPLDANGAWYEGNGVVTSRCWRMGGEYSRVPWRVRNTSLSYGGLDLPPATAAPCAKIYSYTDTIASTNTCHLLEVYDTFPSRVVIRRPMAFEIGGARSDAEFASGRPTIWIDSASCASSEWAGSSKNSLSLYFETNQFPRFLHSTDPASATSADVTHLFAGYAEHLPSPVRTGALPQVNTWPDAAGQGGNGMRYDPSWGYGATSTGCTRSTDTTLGVSVDAIVSTAASGSLFVWTSGASTGPDVNWGSGLTAGVYTCSVLVKSNFAGELQFSIDGGATTHTWLRFEDSAGGWQRISASFYHDGTDRRLAWSCYSIPGTGQPGGAGSIALGLPSVVAGPNPPETWRFPQNATEFPKETYYGTSVTGPAAGTYRVGDTYIVTTPAAGAVAELTCTVAGSPGTWVPTKYSLANGAADEVLQRNGAGTLNEWGKIADANIATNAAIAITKLAGGTKHREMMSWNENGDIWTIDPGQLRTIYEWRPSVGAAFGVFSGWDQVTTNGTPSHPGMGTGSFLAQSRRTQMETGVGANDIAGFESVPVAWRGTGGLGGFFFWARFAMSTSTAGTRCFIGLAESGGNANCAADPGDASSSNCIGVGYDAADANWQVIRADGVPNVTKVNTGLAKDGVTVLELRMFCNPSASEIFVQLYDFNLGEFVVNTSYNTTLPTDSMTLSAFAYCGTAASAVAQDLQLYGLRIESHY